MFGLFKDSNKKGQKVYVGLSGGVDSSVSACLLKDAGFDVTGVFIKVWQPDWIECTWKEDRRDAMRVCAHLGIPFVTLDLEKEYKKEVIDYMISEYENGRTPNPDVMCNKHVKFGGFYDWAMKKGADYVATGHYARIESSPTHSRDNENTKVMLAGLDPNKDQSYFLWTIKKEQLNHILFPIGHLLKSQVRELAEKYGLPNARKKDSQGLCFIGKVDLKEFLSHYVKTSSGNVLNIKGEVIGNHLGALYFTIGERRGFTITRKSPNDAPYYVVGKNIKNNTITVDNRLQKVSEHKENPTGLSSLVSRNSCAIDNCNWLIDKNSLSKEVNLGKKYMARIRYRQALQKIQIKSISNNYREAEIVFDEGQNTITSGQSMVIYDGDVCIGGGVIV